MAAEKVGIEIELVGGQEAYNLLKRIDNQIDTLNKRKKFKSLGGLNSAKGELEGYMNDLKRLNKEQEKWANLAKKVGKENMSAFGVREWDRVKKNIQETQSKIKQMGSDMDSVTQKTRTFGQTFNSISSRVAHIGSAMQSLGNAMTRLTSPFRRLTTGLVMGAGYKALNLFTEGLNNVFTRSDTMKNYDRSLKALGLDTKQTFKVFGEAKTAKENLDEAVQGLPTSLDEIMAAQKVYAGATGEMIESTKTAIAANNTFLASGMGAREQRFMQRYLVAIASGAELTTMQWQSMARIAPLAMRAVSKELGYADDEYAQFTKDVQNGTIAGQEFLKAFQKVGISGAVADAARVQTESWAGLASNIRIAVTRAGQAVIDTLNETFKDATGRTLLQRLLGIDAEGKKMGDGVRDWINGISESVQNWIKANPERIVGFFNDLKSIDWKGLLQGVAEGAGEVAKLISAFAKWASGKDMSQIGKWAVRLNALGSVLTVAGGILKGTRHIWGLIGALGKFGKEGLLGKLFGGLFGKGIGGTVGGGIVGAGINKGTFLGIGKIGLVAAEVTGIVGAITTMATGFFALDMGLIKRGIKNFSDSVKYVHEAIDGINKLKELDGITAVVGKVKQIRSQLWQIKDAFEGKQGDKMDRGVVEKGMPEFSKGTADSLKNLADSVTSMQTVMTTLNTLATTGININIVSKVQQMKRAISEVVKALNGGNGEQAIPTVSPQKATSMKNMADAVTHMRTLVNNLNSLATIGINQNILVKLQQIKRAINQVETAFPNMLNGIKGPANLSKNANAMADGIRGLRRVVWHLNQLAGLEVNNGGITAVVGQIKTALQELQGLSGLLELDIQVKLTSKFKTSVDTVVKQINAGKKRIQDAVKKIPSAITKHISVTITASVNTRQAVAAITNGASYVRSLVPEVHEAKGGLIYRAKGGSIGFPGKPRGVDRVPVWAQAGEFMQSKRAVSTFGIDFMRKVNNLDVKGAMNELMHRAGNMANVNRGTTINNYNNNQRVVINNNGNPGAGFTFKSASRFVGAI